jgi:hypothetical protein
VQARALKTSLNLRFLFSAAELGIAILVVPRLAAHVWPDAIPAVIALALGATTLRVAKEINSKQSRGRLWNQCFICAIIAFVWRWLFGMPMADLWFAPALIGLSSIDRFVGPAFERAWAGIHFLGNKRTWAGIGFLRKWAARYWASLYSFIRRPAATVIVATGPPLFLLYILTVFAPSLVHNDYSAARWVACGWLAICCATAVWREHWLDSKYGAFLPLASGGLVLTATQFGVWSGSGRQIVVWFVWSALAVGCARLLVKRADRPGEGFQEAIRLLFVVGGSTWLMKGFLVRGIRGTGDARWYTVMLQDMILQTRAHEFPVWSGESIYQFNGAIYPLRVAPAFHYVGALLDAASWHTFGSICLLNLLLVGTGVLAAAFAYLAATTILSNRRWAAAFLALSYLACPGVLEVAYGPDLYMSWMTIAWVPVALFLIGRGMASWGRATPLILGASLGLCWWGHSPVALWTTLVASLITLFAMTGGTLSRALGGALAKGALVFGAIAAYPVGSVLLYPPEPGVHTAELQRAEASVIANFIHEAFPGVLLPIEQPAAWYQNFQLGYTLWAIYLLGLFFWFRRRERIRAAFLLAITALLLLMTPLPGWHDGLWDCVPSFIRNVTGNWAMNRIYVVLAALTAVCGALTVAEVPQKLYRIVVAALSLGVGWSFFEAGLLNRSFSASPPYLNATGGTIPPEDVMVTSFAYLIFPTVPSGFSHGVVAPELEYRLLRKGDLAPFDEGKSDANGSARLIGEYGFKRAENDLLWLEVPQNLVLRPGRHYLLVLEAKPGAFGVHGVLQLSGTSFFREYLLPDYGGPRSFGLGGEHSPFLPVWSTAAQGDTVRIRFYPQGTTLAQALNFAQVRFEEYDPAALPIQVEGWQPFRARARMEQAGWLETPREFQTGYAASSDGRAVEVKKSPDGLAMVALPRGESKVELRYRAPWGLQGLFWLSAFSVTAVVAGLSAIGIGWVRRG